MGPYQEFWMNMYKFWIQFWENKYLSPSCASVSPSVPFA